MEHNNLFHQRIAVKEIRPGKTRILGMKRIPARSWRPAFHSQWRRTVWRGRADSPRCSPDLASRNPKIAPQTSNQAAPPVQWPKVTQLLSPISPSSLGWKSSWQSSMTHHGLPHWLGLWRKAPDCWLLSAPHCPASQISTYCQPADPVRQQKYKMATDMAMFWKQTRADQRESLISLRLTWLITRLVNDFAGVSICPRKKALRVNEKRIKFLTFVDKGCKQSYLIEIWQKKLRLKCIWPNLPTAVRTNFT